MVQLNDSMFSLTKRYFRKGKNGFTSATVMGERRIGKTMYCLQTVYQIARYEGNPEKEAWDIALDAVVFTMNDLIKMLVRHNYKNRRKFLIWDDSGVYGSGLLYHTQIGDAAVLKALMDTIGTRVRLVLLTCPNAGGLMKFLRGYSDYLINITVKDSLNNRLAAAREPYMRKNMTIGYRRAWNEEFNVKIDDKVYERYVRKRDKYCDVIIKELIKHGKEGRNVGRETYGEINELVRQDNLFDDVAEPDSEGSVAPDGGLRREIPDCN